MEVLSYVLEGLAKALQGEENDVVIELGPDRILHFIGCYLVLALATLLKISSGLSGEIVSCYPLKNGTGNVGALVGHANAYCWESSSITGHEENYTTITAAKNVSLDRALLERPWGASVVIQRMPYLLVLQAIVFAIPSTVWYLCVGSQLMGHLKFVKILLVDMYTKLREIPAGKYKGKPYDEKSETLNGWGRFNADYKSKGRLGVVSTKYKLSELSKVAERVFHGKVGEYPNPKSEMDFVVHVTSKGILADDLRAEESKDEVVDFSGTADGSWMGNLLFGVTMDKHLFSMLCCENLAPLEYLPYVISVYQLTSTDAASGDWRSVCPLHQGLLRQFCHKDNFSGRFLVKCYISITLCRVAASFAALVCHCYVLVYILSETIGIKPFRCYVPFQDIQFVCAMKGHWNFLAIYLTNVAVVLVHMSLSLFQYYFVRWGSKRALCYFLHDLADSSSVALLAAHFTAHPPSDNEEESSEAETEDEDEVVPDHQEDAAQSLRCCCLSC